MLGTRPAEADASASTRVTLIRSGLRVWYRLDRLIREMVKFATVGSVGYLVDIGLFNTLLFTGGEGPLHEQPLEAKTISVTAATIVTYMGHRAWTFRHRQRIRHTRGYPLFFLFNGLGLGIALACLGFSRYVLDLSGPLADNISANVVGLVLGTLFRYWAYRTWVFPAGTVSAGTDTTSTEPANA